MAIDYPIFAQGTAPRSQLLNQFRATPHAVLFATSSFWQGVDVAGEALSCVIVDKLPFAQGVWGVAVRVEGQFEDVTELAGIHETGYSQGVAVGDFDDDGFDDIFVSNVGARRLFTRRVTSLWMICSSSCPRLIVTIVARDRCMGSLLGGSRSRRT